MPAVAAGRGMARQAREVSRMRCRASWQPLSTGIRSSVTHGRRVTLKVIPAGNAQPGAAHLDQRAIYPSRQRPRPRSAGPNSEIEDAHVETEMQ